MLYTLHVSDPPASYSRTFFPRVYRTLSDAKDAGRLALERGATNAYIIHPDRYRETVQPIAYRNKRGAK